MTNETTGTAGTLTARFTGPASTPDWWIESAAGFVVLTAPQTTTRNAQRIAADVRRAVAAWNACEGIPTEELQTMAPGAFPCGITVRSAACEARRAAESEALRASLAEAVELLAAARGDDHPDVIRLDAIATGKQSPAPAQRIADKRPGWVAVVRGRVGTYGPAAPLDDIPAAELLAEIDARR